MRFPCGEEEMSLATAIVRVFDRLPPGIEQLARAASAEDIRNVSMLLCSYEDGLRSDRAGEALFAGFVDGELAGVGGVTPCPDVPDAERMRRFYVAPAFRRTGMGRALAAAAMQEGLQHARILTCNARASAGAAPFWEAMGFRPVSQAGITHLLEV
jgi:GNAT superfamily N-acetyltransferase